MGTFFDFLEFLDFRFFLDFLHGDNHQEKVASEITTFDQQYRWIEPINIFVFLYRG